MLENVMLLYMLLSSKFKRQIIIDYDRICTILFVKMTDGKSLTLC